MLFLQLEELQKLKRVALKAMVAESARHEAHRILRQVGVAELLVELDGCQIRTVKCATMRDAATQQITKRVRELAWRQVWVGLAGRLWQCDENFGGAPRDVS